MNKSRFGVFCLFLFVCTLITPVSLMAQQSADEGAIEVAGSVGVSAGLGTVDQFMNITGLVGDLANLSNSAVRFDPGSNTKWNIGASGGYAVRNNLMVVAELVRTRLADPTLTFGPIASITSLEFNSSLLELTGGVQYSVPLRNSTIVPFAGAGLGLARSTIGLKDTTFNVLDVSLSENNMTVNVGGGARIYLSPRWGVRPEFKVVHIPDETFVRFAVGVFYQFRK